MAISPMLQCSATGELMPGGDPLLPGLIRRVRRDACQLQYSRACSFAQNFTNAAACRKDFHRCRAWLMSHDALRRDAAHLATELTTQNFNNSSQDNSSGVRSNQIWRQVRGDPMGCLDHFPKSVPVQSDGQLPL